MKFDLLPIINADGRKLSLETELDFSGMSEVNVTFLSPVHVSGEFVNIGGSIELKGLISCKVEYSCDRCCETYDADFECSFEELFKKEDVRNEDNNPDAVILEGTVVDIDEIVFNNIVVNLPLKRLCSDDCKGLCTNCGQNLNKGMCGCDTRTVDPRFDALDKFFK